ncbi:MAG: CRTAC1 family protein [Gemmatimonadaceae bacterium]|nr:CRTAC1 family protein [Gemmatimonadaceae bacterium]
MHRPRGLAATLLLLLTAPSADGQVTFLDVTDQAGVGFHYTHGGTGRKHFIETMGPGCAFLDYDGDGRLDIYAVNGHALDGSEPIEANELYRNLGDGTFREVGREAGADDRGYGVGVTAADYDNDGDLDLFLTNYGPNVLLRGRGDGTFADHTAQAGVGDSLWGTGCAFLDYDNDGLLDLYVANYVEYSLDAEGRDLTPYFLSAPGQELSADLRAYPSPENFPGSPDVLYRNAGDGTYADVTAAAGVLDPAGKGMGIVCADYDGDGDSDVFVANDQTANFLYRNDGDGTFTDVALLSGVGYSGDGRPEASMGADFGDYDNDGLLDLVVPNFHREPTSLYRNEGDGLFSWESMRSGLGRPSLAWVGWGTAFLDYDNDGFLDVFVANGHTLDNADLFDASSSYAQPDQLFRNIAGRFEDVSAASGEALAAAKVSRGAAFGDYDDDGDTDIFVVHSTGRADLLRNEGGNAGHWLQVRTVGERANRDGVGARIEVVSGDLRQVREIRTGSGLYSQNDLRASFGLGERERVELLEVRWPGGGVDRVEGLSVNRLVVVAEGVGLVEDAEDLPPAGGGGE